MKRPSWLEANCLIIAAVFVMGGLSFVVFPHPALYSPAARGKTGMTVATSVLLTKEETRHWGAAAIALGILIGAIAWPRK